MAILLWTVLAVLAPSAHAADGLMGWRAWFWSEPGGPLDAPGHSAPSTAPAGDWRDFEPPADLSRVFSDAAFSDAVRGTDGVTRVAYRYGGDVFLAQRTGVGTPAGWRHEFIGSTELEWGDVALGLDSRGRVHAAFESAHDLAGEKRWIQAVREPYGMWRFETLPRGAGGGRPWFGASPEGGLALYFTQAVAPVALPLMPSAPAPRPRRGLWLLGLAPIGLMIRTLLVARRMHARRRLRGEAALVGRGLCLDVVARRKGAFGPASPGVLLLNARVPVLFMDGLRPSEAWLGKEWTVLEGKPGWVEAKCGPLALEVAPEPGVWPAFSGAGARRLLEAVRAERGRAARLVS